MKSKHEVRKAVYTIDNRIDCEINHVKLGWIPFTVSDKDPEELGRELYKELINNTHGDILEYTSPVITEEVLAQSIRNERDNLLSELDQVIMNPLRWEDIQDKVKDEVRVYRKNLLDIPQQKSFPLEVTFPSKPDVLDLKDKTLLPTTTLDDRVDE